jgi:hypothetical protein
MNYYLSVPAAGQLVRAKISSAVSLDHTNLSPSLLSNQVYGCEEPR